MRGLAVSGAAPLRVLLTEGSSLTSRETVTCLGPLGHRLEALDPDPLCIARFSRWVTAVHRCPSPARDPHGYVRVLLETVRERGIDVVLPTHEQAWLLAAAHELLPAGLAVALAPIGAFDRVQSKVAFARLLDELALPQPEWRAVRAEGDLDALPYPYWLKAAHSTAGQGVFSVRDARSRAKAAEQLLPLVADGAEVMSQQPAAGRYGQAQALFDRGRLVAVHTSVQTGVGIGPSAAARESVDHPEPRRHAAALGEALGWHGGLTLDYMHVDGTPSYIECNPRTVEPANGAASGVNIPELQLRVTLGETPPRAPVPRAGVRTHGTLALVLGAAAYGGTRRAVLVELAGAALRRDHYRASREALTPVLRDPPSAAPLVFVLARALFSPARATRLARDTVARYSITPEAIARVSRTAPRV